MTSKPRTLETPEASAVFPLFPQETIVATFAGRSVVVTNCRVRSYSHKSGESAFTSIFLEDVVSCSVTALSKPWLLIVGAVLLLTSLVIATSKNVGGGWIAGVLVALAFGAAYFFTLRNVVQISSAAASIRIDVAGAPEARIQELVDTIEASKDARYRIGVR